MVLIYILLAILIVSLVSLIGILTFWIKENLLKKYILFLVAISAGLLIGNSFFHLIPESFELFQKLNLTTFLNPSMFILLGIIFFYIIERFIFWHHHHELDCKKHTISSLTLIGDAFHNLVDGLLIAGAFLVDINIGIATTIGILFHEIPQELADFSLLIHSGFSKVKALFFNFLSATFAFIGGLIGYFSLNSNLDFLPFFIAFIAGNFIYLSLVDILPELKKSKGKNFIELFFLGGILISFLFLA